MNETLFLLQEQLVRHDFRSFSSLKPNLLEAVDEMLANDIAHLMAMIPQEVSTAESLVEGQDSGEFVVAL
jgi:EH domain-containing protein 1